MQKLTEKAQVKAGTIVLAITALVLITAIISILIGTSNTNKLDMNLAERSDESADVQKIRESEPKPTQNIEVQPIVKVPQVVEQTDISQKTDQTPESKQTEAPVKSIQEGQTQIDVKPTPPPKPVPHGEVTDKTVKPTYREQDVTTQKSQPKMGDKNDMGQIYIDGFGWVKDEGGGGKGTVVDDMRENGNKIGIMN